jgi:hypothetical protein
MLRAVGSTAKGQEPEAFAEWCEYLAPILVEGANAHAEIVVPELSTLAGDHESLIMAARDDYPPKFLNRYKIDREKSAALFGQHLDDVLTSMAEYSGTNAYAERAKTDARIWFTERRPPDVG